MPRNAEYGDPNQDFQRIAEFWNVYLRGVAERKLAQRGYSNIHLAVALGLLDDLVDTWDVGQMMTLLKISRSTVSPGKQDHYVDAAGYQACAADCADAAGVS